MKTLIFGAGPIGSVYAYLLHKASKDVTILARNKQFDFIKENGVVLVNEFTGKINWKRTIPMILLWLPSEKTKSNRCCRF